MEILEPRDWLLAGALLVCAVFGVVGRLSGFCLRSALAEVAEQTPGLQTAAWIVAVAASCSRHASCLPWLARLDLAASIYLSSVTWPGVG